MFKPYPSNSELSFLIKFKLETLIKKKRYRIIVWVSISIDSMDENVEGTYARLFVTRTWHLLMSYPMLVVNHDRVETIHPPRSACRWTIAWLRSKKLDLDFLWVLPKGRHLKNKHALLHWQVGSDSDISARFFYRVFIVRCRLKNARSIQTNVHSSQFIFGSADEHLVPCCMHLATTLSFSCVHGHGHARAMHYLSTKLWLKLYNSSKNSSVLSAGALHAGAWCLRESETVISRKRC